MSKRAYTNVGIWMGGYDLSGYLRGLSIDTGAEMLDKTTFADLTRVMHPGLKFVRVQTEGLWDSAVPEEPIITNIGQTQIPFSMAPDNTEGAVAFTFLAAKATYEPGGNVGDMLTFSAQAEASGSRLSGSDGTGLVRGRLLAKQSGLTGSGATTKFTLPAVGAGQKLYAALHVLGAGTGTFDGVLQSDADGSAGGETNRITFTQATGVTSEWKSVAGAITDTYWRLSYTIGGGAPSFSVALIAGVL